MPSAILLAHIEMWVTELEREVQAFEAAVQEVEEEMEKAEHEEHEAQEYAFSDENKAQEARGDTDPSQRGIQHPRLQRLERALEKARQVENLVKAANETLSDALDAASLVAANEHLAEDLQPEPAALPSQAIPPVSSEPSELPELSGQRPIIKATPVSPLSNEQQADVEPLTRGSVILNDRYRIVDLLCSRPRVNLYLAHRLTTTKEQQQGAPVLPLVAIRELVLSGLSPDMQKRVEQAAFEEFVAPGMFGSPRLPGVGDRISIEQGRHYLVMQLRPVRNQQANGQVMAVPLSELLLKNQQWPSWLGAATALAWGIQLCRIVARLHRMGGMLGGLNPATILVDSSGPSDWAPVLLVSWPPALQFWPDAASRAAYSQVFPIAVTSGDNPFAAPETFSGQADERSDIYSLGALLYLFFTRYAPIAATLRLSGEQAGQFTSMAQGQHGYQSSNGVLVSEEGGGMALVPPHLFSNVISPELEAILLRALALSPNERFPHAFAMVEALEAIDPARLTSPYMEHRRIRQDSKVTKALWGLRRHS
ncbi:MAG TPA: hypothetical protein VKT25_13525 [Ktedonobacteraceae bacterium]|nr:hypothetical protein [Ktedonobacteraceae bacterium]